VGELSEMGEKELLKKCRQGDRDAFNILVQTYQRQVINLAYGMLSNTEDATDAAQEVFIKVYRNIDRFEGKSSLSTWIYRITSNVCKDFLRKRTRTIQSHLM
jgi:RNA polymerase sigma-70 factor (ECF subfamily)